MTKSVKWRRGTTAEHSSFTGLSGEITVDTTKKTAIVHDEATAGGFSLAREDLSNVSVEDIADHGIAKNDLSNLTGADATESQKGVIQLATSSEAQAGTNTTKAITPATLSEMQGGSFPIGFINGFVISQATDTDHDIDFGTGSARSSDNTYNIVETSAKIKQIDANWTAGSNVGGFPSGATLPASGTVHCFIIMKSSDGTIDAGFDTSLTATNLLTDATDFDKYRRIGSFITDASSNIIGFTAKESAGGGVFTGHTLHINDLLSETSQSTTMTDLDLSVPNGINLLVNLTVRFYNDNSNTTNKLLVEDDVMENRVLAWGHIGGLIVVWKQVIFQLILLLLNGN